jgi:hypothetical protein
MRLRKQIFLSLFLILSTVVSGTVARGIFHGDISRQTLSRRDLLRSSSRLAPLHTGIRFLSAGLFKTSFYSQGHAASGQPVSKVEKHHQRTIASEAIIADFSFPPPQFSYYLRNYSLFLPGGCSQTAPGGSFLRGPPFWS